MLKKRFKNLLCYCIMFSMVMCNLLFVQVPKVNAMTPGTETKELDVNAEDFFVIDTRYNYKIKKSDFIEYCENLIPENAMYNIGEIDGVKNAADAITNKNEIDWEGITSFSFYINEIGYGIKYNEYNSRSHITATVEGEYLVFDFYSKRNFDIFVNYLNNQNYNSLTEKSCMYDSENNELMINLWQSALNSGFQYHDQNADTDYKYVPNLDIGYEVRPNEVIIHQLREGNLYCDIEVVDSRYKTLDLTNECLENQGPGHEGVSWDISNDYFVFNDTYSKYTLIDIQVDYVNEKKMLIFEVEYNASNDYIHYVDYFTGTTIYEQPIIDGQIPTLYEDTSGTYDVWINSETNLPVEESELTGGLIVFGLCSQIDSRLDDVTEENLSINTSWVIDTNSINSLDTIQYVLQRDDVFNESDYPILNINNTLYKGSVLTATEIKQLYSYLWKIGTYKAEIKANIYDSKTGQVETTTDDVLWTFDKVNNIDISSNVGCFGFFDDDSINYKLKISDTDKASYPNLFVFDSNFNMFDWIKIYKLYSNQTYNYKDVSNIKKIINATKESNNNITCTENAFEKYIIEYGFSDIKFETDSITTYNTNNLDANTNQFANEYVSSLLSHDTPFVNCIYFNHIESFDELANPYILEQYGIHQYESFYLMDEYDGLYLEMFPLYENGNIYYIVNYNNTPNNKGGIYGSWDNYMKFNVNKDVNKYNQWVDSLPVDENGKHYLIYAHNIISDYNLEEPMYLVTANRDNPNHTFSDSSLETQINAMTFNLSGDYDGTTTVPSTFLKTSDNDALYVKGINLHSGSNYVLETTTDALGHLWEGSEWHKVNTNNISANTDITNINNNVVDLDTLLQYAENDVNETLLNDNNNKLYYRICSRMGDAYELEIRSTHVHTYGNPTFTWNEDYSECIAIFKCTSNDDTQTKNCTVTKSTVDATCTKDGKTTYTAAVEFNGNSYTDTKEKTLTKLGHEFGEWYEVKAPTIDAEGVAQRDCIRNDATEQKPIVKLTKTAIVSGILKDENGKPIANKKVELHSEPRYTYTDANGCFEFKNVELGEHTLKVFNNDNTLICELSLTVDKIESKADEKYVDDNFTWDKIITVSDIALEIDGIADKSAEPMPEKSAETGDSSNIRFYVILLMAAFASVGVVGFIANKKIKISDSNK